MIQIQRREQFTRAAERLTREPQSIRRHEPHLYEVTNKAKGHQYHVRIESRNGLTFGTCTCEAGTPHAGRRVPKSASTSRRSFCSCAQFVPCAGAPRRTKREGLGECSSTRLAPDSQPKLQPRRRRTIDAQI